MKIVLIKEVAKLGKPWEIKEVRKGYARNFLFPRNLAVLATKKMVAKAKVQAKVKMAQAKKEIAKVKKVVEELKKLTVKITAKSTKAGALFSSITKNKLAKEIEKMLGNGDRRSLLKIDPKKVLLDKPIKKVGDYKVKVELEKGLVSEIKVKIKGILK